MARPGAIWSACIVLALAGGATCAAAADPRDIVSQDLKQLRAPGKVEAAIWARRTEGYTLQVVLKYNGFGQLTLVEGRARNPAVEAELPSPAQPPALPQLRVWVLRADGTMLQPRRAHIPNPATAGLRTIAMDATYVFPDSAGKDAVAVAIQVDGEFYIQKLESFGS